MPGRRLRFSERRRLAETGSLGDLVDFPSKELRRAMVHMLDRVQESRRSELKFTFRQAVQDVSEEHFGWDRQQAMQYPLTAPTTEDLLDFLEIVVEVGNTSLNFPIGAGQLRSARPWDTAEEELNQL